MTNRSPSDSTGTKGAAAPTPHIRLELQSQPRLLPATRALISNLAQRLGFDDVQSGQVTLAVDEALCNIISHGYGRKEDQPIWLNVWALEAEAEGPGRKEAGLRIVIEDNARQVEPDSIRSRDLDDIRPGGLGVFIIREIMDEVLFEKREGQGMRLTMVKRLTPTDPGTGATDTSESGGRP